MKINLFLEITSVLFSLVFLILLIKEKKICWFFGIASSLVSILLFYRIKLYSESILYIYYIIIGIYGFILWNKKENTPLKISEKGILFHFVFIIVGIIASLCLGYFFQNYTTAKNAFLDAFTTIFSFIASYLEAKKILSTWIFWIFINGVTILLYAIRDLYIYALLILVYFVISFFGYFKWRKSYLAVN